MLYLRDNRREASPKAISGSASYLQVCLAFHSDPHLIPTLFSGFRFGPPPDFTQVSTWTWIDHLASGLPHATAALFRLGFPTAPGLLSLNLATYGNSQAHSTKGTPSPESPPALTACKSTVSGSLSLPSRGSFHLSLTVLCAIGSCRVFSLGGWSPLLPAGFLVSRRTLVPCPRRLNASRTGLSPALAGLPRPFRSHCALSLREGGRSPSGMHSQPRRRNASTLARHRFGLLPVRSPLLGESRLISFPAGT